MRNGVVGVSIAAATVDAIIGSVVSVFFVVDAVVVIVVVVIVVGVGVAFSVGDGDGDDNNNSDDGKADDVFACALVEVSSGSFIVENNTPLWYWESVTNNRYFS